MRIYFHTHPEHFMSCFRFLIIQRPSCHNSSFLACSYHSPNLTGESFKYPLISSCSLRSHVSKSLQVSSFVFKFFPVNCALATLFSNFYGGSFKISLPLLSYQFIRCFQIPPVVPSIPSQVYAISLFILFQWEYVVCQIRCFSSIKFDEG